MGKNSSIEWTNHSFNPWIGCTRVSPGCVHCYAETQNVRWRGGSNWGPGAPRQVTSVSNWKQPLKWNREAQTEGVRRQVFCASLADWADVEAPDGGRDWLFEMIRTTPNLDWLLLTKRTGRIRECLPADWGDGYRNVWLGTTVEDAPREKERVVELLGIPAWRRFLSMEPLIEKVDISGWLALGMLERFKTRPGRTNGIDWVIIGGESGPRARPFNLDWAREIVRQCRAAGAAPFVKQLGAHPVEESEGFWGVGEFALRLNDSHGGDPSEWPADLRVREFPKETR